MYPPGGERGAVGKVQGLHPTYRYLDRMFRKTIDYKGGDKGNIADYSRNLVIARSQWIDWQYIRELQKASVDHAITICQRT